MHKINLNIPNITNLEKKYVNDVIKSKWLSSNGKHTIIFEKKFSKFIGVKNSIAVQSGTAALHVAMKGIGVKNGDKVIIPNFTCNSNISSVSQCNAIPVVVEIENDTLGLDFEEVKKAIKKYKPKALQLVHIYGFPCRDTKKIISYCKKKNVIVVEDASEALGAKISKKFVGSFGDVSVFSVRSEKMIGVGEGGIVLSNNKIFFDKIKTIASRNSPFRNAKDPYWKKYFTNGEGYNYLMPHLLGAVGRGQIERFKKDILIKKIKVGLYYREIFKDRRIVFSQIKKDNSSPVYWLNSVHFPTLKISEIRSLANYLEKNGVEIRPGFWPLNKLNYKIFYQGNKANTEYMFKSSIILPSNYLIKRKEIKFIYDLIIKYLNDKKL